ncbi:hypothetical protein [Actinomadura sp. WMMA1423]|uniref:hypothetical protein n=1 Tax=Actinomadura sp. WMMA1423 TaxID=2591108 RepID=UPI001146857A|nr:hypothetical protein [Actinomadura sp. WMMA1423]
MNSEKPNNRRFLLAILAAIVLLTGVGAAVALTAGSDGDDDRPGTVTTTKPPEAQPRPVIAMVEHGEQHAMLAFRVMPTGQLTGLHDGEQAKYTLVHFDGQGKVVKEEKYFGGTGQNTTFQFQGLYDEAPLSAHIVGDGSPNAKLHFDDTFGVEEYDWTIIPSEDKFDAAVKKYAERFNDCSKKQDVNPCEGVA